MPDNDLDTLAPPGQTVTVAGQSITVKPLTVGQIPRFARAIRQVPGLTLDGSTDWLGLMADHGDALIEAAAIATGVDEAKIVNMEADAFIELATAIVEENVGFFIARLAPAFERASERIVKAIGAGATPSKP